MRKFRFCSLATVALFGALSACAHSQATKQTPEGPKLGTPAEEKPKRPTEPPPPAANNNETAGPTDSALYLDYNSALLATESRPVLQHFAEQLKANRKASLRIEGNCDERGTTEYNLALGAHRAEAARQYLQHLGVSSHRVKTISYGKDRPKYEGHDESAWGKNRRDDLIVK